MRREGQEEKLLVDGLLLNEYSSVKNRESVGLLVRLRSSFAKGSEVLPERVSDMNIYVST